MWLAVRELMGDDSFAVDVSIAVWLSLRDVEITEVRFPLGCTLDVGVAEAVTLTVVIILTLVGLADPDDEISVPEAVEVTFAEVLLADAVGTAVIFRERVLGIVGRLRSALVEFVVTEGVGKSSESTDETTPSKPPL